MESRITGGNKEGDTGEKLYLIRESKDVPANLAPSERELIALSSLLTRFQSRGNRLRMRETNASRNSIYITPRPPIHAHVCNAVRPLQSRSHSDKLRRLKRRRILRDTPPRFPFFSRKRKFKRTFYSHPIGNITLIPA